MYNIYSYIHMCNICIYVSLRIIYIYIYIYIFVQYLFTNRSTGQMRTRHAYWWIHASMRCVFQSEDVLAVKSTGLQSTGNNGEYVVLRKCPAESAARLRVSEKHFVADHALFLAQRFGRGPCLGKSTLAKCWASRNVWEHHYSNWSGSSLQQIGFPTLNDAVMVENDWRPSRWAQCAETGGHVGAKLAMVLICTSKDDEQRAMV